MRLAGKVARGYEIDDFKHAFERYLPPVRKAATTVTSVTYEGKNVTAPSNVAASGVTDQGHSVTASSTNVTAPMIEGVTQIPLVKQPFVAGVTAVTRFLGNGAEGSEDQLIEEAKRLFNAVPAQT